MSNPRSTSTRRSDGEQPWAALQRLLWADAVAVVGASDRRGSLGRRVMTEILSGGFAGRVIPVTPTHATVAGMETAPSLAEIDGDVDLAVLAVADERLEDQVERAVSCRIPGIVVFSPAQGAASDGSPLRDRLGEITRRAGAAMCGPNGMGFVNVEHGLRATGYYQPPGLKPGGLAFLSHSGSLFSAMLHNRRGLRFNLVVSTGLETATTMDQYLDHVLDLDSTRAVGLFLETIRRPDEMASALRRAAEKDVPVVALKVGRTERARQAAATHSGALAGEDAAYDAFFDFHGVHRVDTMDEMADTLEIFSTGLRARRGRLGAVHDSGGERSLLLDTAAATGVPLAVISEATRHKLSAVLEPGLEPDNPVDAWGTGHGHERIFSDALHALAEDPAVGVVAFCVDLTAEEDPSEGYSPLLKSIAGTLPVPLVVMGNLVSGIDPTESGALRQAGIPVLEGTHTGLKAIAHLLSHADRAPQDTGSRRAVAGATRERWRKRLRQGDTLGEAESLALIADYGIPVVGYRQAGNVEEAREAASALGWPVALKTAGSLHKSDVDGVKLNLGDEYQVGEAYHDLCARLGPDVLVQSMAPPGVELALGVAADPQFGPMVVVAGGGVLVEVLSDRALALPPIDEVRAGRLLARLRADKLLDGIRGGGPARREAITGAIVAMSAMATDLGDLIEGIDVNPLIATTEGVLAVDALVVPRS